ncbi:putative membrane protein [Sphingomonas jejuensis]|uniref:Membrane protein n=1 Tax=Sphingomonas jejuensis TaxID=904715 RepID=A0ABX0XKP3_9SPHN|nr:cytochrome c oxidase assembly protein [Sphingomonas jejuensis]NJC33933.1 putative membrane protein [Sphingomonas jejuensis]
MTAAGLIVALVGTLVASAGLGMTGHMIGHMLAVAVAGPMLAIGLQPVLANRRLPGAIAAMLIELAIVWGWHMPAVRAATDMSLALMLVEQASFLAAGTLLWTAALRERVGGVAALLLTSMHMTLLGALIGLAPRRLYPMMAMHGGFGGLDALADQQLGGVVMLTLGGASYLMGGLWMLGTLLNERVRA